MMAANFRQGSRTSGKELHELIDAQIENSLALGWKPQDIVIVSNIELDLPVTVVCAPMDARCLTGSKMFALQHLFSCGLIRDSEVWWAHDLDAWQNHWFDPPPLLDIGLAEYSTPEFNGGSVLLRAAARDLVDAIVADIRAKDSRREEPSINSVLRSAACQSRVTVLDSTFNVGCSGYAVRHRRSAKPILVSHLHPRGGTAWRTHTRGDRFIAEGSLCPRLFELLVRHFHGGVPPASN